MPGRVNFSVPAAPVFTMPTFSASALVVECDQGVTILLVEQNASRALQIADRGYVMDSGLITMTGEARQMLDDPKVRAAYLGE